MVDRPPKPSILTTSRSNTRRTARRELEDNAVGAPNPDLDDGVPPDLVQASDAFNIPPSQTMTVKYKVTVNGPIPSVSSVVNTVTVTSNEQVIPLEDTEIDPVVVPDLSLTKTDGVTLVTAGSTTTYSLTVSNTGPVPTTGTITVVDVLPAGMTVPDGAVTLGGVNGANWTCAALSNVLTCTSTTAIPATTGTSVFSFVANISLSASGSLVNKARVGGDGDPEAPDRA